MSDGTILPVTAGLAIGVSLIIILALLFKPVEPLSDVELLAKTREIREVQFFLSEYPDAKPRIEREKYGEQEITTVTYALERDVYEPAAAFGEIGFGRIRELGLILEYYEVLGRMESNPRMHVQCGGPISIHQSGINITALIEESSSCLEKRLATNLTPRLSRDEVLEIARKDIIENLVESHQIFDFREQPDYVLLPENRTISPLVYVAQNGTHYLIDAESNNRLSRPCNLSDQQLCYPGDRDSQPHIAGHLVYILEVTWQVSDVIGGGTRYMIDGNTGEILYPTRTSVCGESIEVVKTIASFSVLLPTKLPDGYSLQSVDYVPHVQLILQYFTRSVCDPNNPYSPDEGVIEIVEGPLIQVSDAKTGEEYVQREIAKYKASNLNATSYIFRKGTMHAVGYDAGINCNAHLWVIDDKIGTIVKIEARSADIPLKQLALIGSSLEEY